MGKETKFEGPFFHLFYNENMFLENRKKFRAITQKRKEGTKNTMINILGNSILTFFIASHYKETQKRIEATTPKNQHAVINEEIS